MITIILFWKTFYYIVINDNDHKQGYFTNFIYHGCCHHRIDDLVWWYWLPKW